MFPKAWCVMLRRLSMLVRCFISAGLTTLGGWSARGAEPVWSVLPVGLPGREQVRNGDFEGVQGSGFAGWRAASGGLAIAPGEGRDGSVALVGELRSGSGWVGASQTLTLNRTDTAPFVVSGWSRAEHVTGSPGSDYSLYVDLEYADGTPLWGQTANFRCGSHDWERREFMIHPEKPVRSLTLHCLFRGRTGKVWFDDVSVLELATDGETIPFQGAVVRLPSRVVKPAGPLERLHTVDGLSWVRRGEQTEELRVGNEPVRTGGASGFLVRDVAARSGFFPLTDGSCRELGLAVQAEVVASANHLVVKGRIADRTGRDRAVTLLFAVPVDATGWRWGDDIRRSRAIDGRAEFVNQVPVHCGATGTLSTYPVGAVWSTNAGLALGLDMAKPAVYRLGYQAALKVLFVAYDFGLVPEAGAEPGSADFRFVLYAFEPKWGFRAAWAKYMALFPEAFVVRAREQGLWMPFTEVGRVPGWGDFGFKFHEGDNNVPWDDAHGVLSFRYTEPMTWWMPMPKGVPRTPAEAMRVRDELLRGTDAQRRRMAEVTGLSAMYDGDDQPALQFQDAPWCDGAVWSLNPNPWLGATGSANAATVYWDEATRRRLYGPEANGRRDGEYLDSLEGYMTAHLNFRREHFRHSTVPLTFDSATHRPALFKGLAVAEFTRWIAEDLHRMDRLVFANGVPYRFTFLCPWLDVLGTETDWMPGGRYRPASEATLCLWRTMSGAKPYLLLMNTDYDRFGPEFVAKYFQRALAFGFWPGFFSHNAADNPYWQNPKWFERDRPLFRQYVPVLRRVTEAGWQPVPYATAGTAGVEVERFGPGTDGAVYFTVFNDTAQDQDATLRFEKEALGATRGRRFEELVAGAELRRDGGDFRLKLPPETVRVVVAVER